MQYIQEYREGTDYDLGAYDTTANIIVNSAGFFQLDNVPQADPLSVDRPNGRKDYLLCYVEEGTIMATIACESVRIAEGVFVYPPGIPQLYRSINTDGPLKIFWIHFTGHGASEIFASCGIGGRNTFQTGKSVDLATSFRRVIEEISLKQHAYETYAASLTEHIIATMARLSSRTGKDASILDKRLIPILQYIHSNYNEEMDLTMLSDMAKLSVSRFSSLFCESIGLYPKAYITKYRIDKACEMIKNTEFSISQIAYLSGYSDPLYFSRIFKRYTGVSPSRFADI